MKDLLRLFRTSLKLTVTTVLAATVFTTVAQAQIAAPPAGDPSSRSQATSSAAAPTTPPLPSAADMAADASAFDGLLGQINNWAQKTNTDLGKARADKWKADGNTKQQGQSNVDSLQRNLTAALPQFITQLQATPQQLAPNLKLYRNLNALYDVLASVAESTGAFGSKDAYQPLADDTGRLDSLRRQVADRLDWLSGVRDNEIGALRIQLQAARAQIAAAPPKKVSDEAAPAEKKPTKKKAKKTTAKPPAAQ